MELRPALIADLPPTARRSARPGGRLARVAGRGARQPRRGGHRADAADRPAGPGGRPRLVAADRGAGRRRGRRPHVRRRPLGRRYVGARVLAGDRAAPPAPVPRPPRQPGRHARPRLPRPERRRGAAHAAAPGHGVAAADGVTRRARGGDVLHRLGGVGAAHQPGAPVGAHGASAAPGPLAAARARRSCRRRRTGSITRRRTRPTTASPPAGTTRGPPGPGSSPGSNGSSRGSPGWCRAPTRRRDEALALHAAHDRAAPLRHRLDQRRLRRRARLHRPRRGGLLPLSVDLHGARAADAVSAGLHAGAPAPRAGRRLRVRRDQRHAPPEQGARRQRHRLRAGRGAARRLAGAGRRRADTGAVPRPRLVPAVADALLGDVRAARAALRPQAGTGRVPAGVAHRPDLLRDERAAAAAHDAADHGAGDGLLRLGGERPGAGLGVEPARRRAVPRDPRADGRLPVPGSIAPSTACRCCGASTRFTTRPRRWTGSRARACTSSTWR